MLRWAGSIEGYDPTTRLYTLVLPTGRAMATRAAELNENYRHLEVLRLLRGKTLWMDPNCTVDLPPTTSHRWWVMAGGDPDPSDPSQYVFTGALHELGGQRLYDIPT
eukprot:798221-Rhodomonas_salina.1